MLGWGRVRGLVVPGDIPAGLGLACSFDAGQEFFPKSLCGGARALSELDPVVLPGTWELPEGERTLSCCCQVGPGLAGRSGG